MSVATNLTELVARRKAAASATARQTVAESVKKQALGLVFTDAELDALRDALDALNMPAEAVDEQAGLYAQYPHLKARVDGLPTPEQMAEDKKKLEAELIQAEGKLQFAKHVRQYSPAMEDEVQAVRTRYFRFGQAEESIRQQLWQVAEKLKDTFALVGPPPEPKPAPAAEENATPAKGKKATAAK